MIASLESPRKWSMLTLLCLAASCAGGNEEDPAPRIIQVVDLGSPTDFEDVSPPVVDSEPFVLQVGTKNALMIRGTVLMRDRVLEPGDVLVVEGEILCVSPDCSGHSSAAGATWIETQGVISPGLIDGHNHLGYNFLPPWEAGRMFANRYDWADDPSYESHIAPYAAHRSTGTHYCPAAMWGELRSLIHGTTTVQGQSFAQSCVEGGARNADHLHHLQHDHMRTSIGSVRDLTDADAENLLDSFSNPSRPVTRYAVHLAEGVSGAYLEEEFASFAGRDLRENRHRGVSLLQAETSVLIHAMAVDDLALQEIAATESKIVWSPSSNMALYGATADIARILELGIATGIGPDWTISGEYDMLSELRYAHGYGQENDIQVLSYEKLWRMATVEGALVVGLDEFIGVLEVGHRADIVVFSTPAGEDPYQTVIESRPEDIGLVIVDGEVHYGARHLRDVLGRNSGCEHFEVCGENKFLCVKDARSNASFLNVGDIETALIDILEGNGYPPEEQYGRGDELLPLYLCGD